MLQQNCSSDFPEFLVPRIAIKEFPKISIFRGAGFCPHPFLNKLIDSKIPEAPHLTVLYRFVKFQQKSESSQWVLKILEILWPPNSLYWIDWFRELHKSIFSVHIKYSTWSFVKINPELHFTAYRKVSYQIRVSICPQFWLHRQIGSKILDILHFINPINLLSLSKIEQVSACIKNARSSMISSSPAIGFMASKIIQSWYFAENVTMSPAQTRRTTAK